MEEKKKKKKAKVDGGRVWMFIITMWIHQGFTYLDRTEMFYRVIWELIPLGLFYSLFYLVFGWGWLWSLFFAFIIGHTLNFLFNYNFWTGVDFTFPSFRNPGNEKSLEYLRQMQSRMNCYDCISGCMLYGSLSRAVWGVKSDLDVRIFRKPGLWNGFKAYWVTFTERLIAVRQVNPMDMYLADDVDFLKKLRSDEQPIFLKATDQRLKNFYRSVKTVNFDEVRHMNEMGIKVEDLKESIYR